MDSQIRDYEISEGGNCKCLILYQDNICLCHVNLKLQHVLKIQNIVYFLCMSFDSSFVLFHLYSLKNLFVKKKKKSGLHLVRLVHAGGMLVHFLQNLV